MGTHPLCCQPSGNLQGLKTEAEKKKLSIPAVPLVATWGKMLINSGVNMPSFAVVVDITDDVKEETPLILDEDFELRSSHKKPSVYYRTFLTAGSCWTHKSWRICDFGEKKEKKEKLYIYKKTLTVKYQKQT